MKITRNETEYTLTAEELEAAYREQEKIYRIEDAKTHAEDIPGREVMFSEQDYEDMADRFFKVQDCNLDENSLWDAIVWDFAKRKAGVA